MDTPQGGQSMGAAEPEISVQQANQEHSGDDVDEEMAAQMFNLVGHVSSAIEGVRTAHMKQMKKAFQDKLVKQMKSITEAVKAQVEKEKLANLEQLRDIKENVTLANISHTMQKPQKRARPEPPVSPPNLYVGPLEESKDPVVPKPNLASVGQPATHAAQNVPTLQQHVKLIREGQGIPPDQLLMFDHCYRDLVQIMHETGQAPSVMQFAVAVAAYLNMQGQLHQVWSQPPGTGKTRTLVSLVYILSTIGNAPDITVRCPSKLLLEQDQFALEEVKAAVKGDSIVRFSLGANKLGREGTIEIIDECDELILDGDKFAKAHKNIATFIGLTATPIKGTTHSSEKELMTALGIQVHDSAIPVMGHISEDLSAITWEQFMDPRRTNNARLVYVYRIARL